MNPSTKKRHHLIACLIASLSLTGLVTETFAADAASTKQGATLFKSRCATCHGNGGKGDGPASRTLPVNPANLTLSRAPNDYIKLMIIEGGDAMGRSSSMPAWGNVLTSIEIESLLLHINTLRPSPK
jgi:mono/diheme cytochrome c family protein